MSFVEIGGPSYKLPEMRPFRQIASRIRLVGGAVVTEHGRLESDNYVAGVSGWSIDGDGDVEFNSGTFRGNIAGATIDIGGADTTSFHVDAAGNLWLGAASFASAPFKISSTGEVTSTNASSTISGATITGGVVQTATSGQRIKLDSTGYLSFYSTSYGLSYQMYANSDDLYFSSLSGSGVVNMGDLSVTNVQASVLTLGTLQGIGGGTINVDDDVQLNADLTMTGILTLSSGQVTRGAIDSGGAGFRLLRVPN